MSKDNNNQTKSLRAKLSNQYVGLFSIIYFILMVVIIITIITSEYISITTNVINSINNNVHTDKIIIGENDNYYNGYDRYILSYVMFENENGIIKQISGQGAMPQYDYLSTIRIGDGIRYFAKTGDTIFSLKHLSNNYTTIYIKFDLFKYTIDNVFLSEIIALFISFTVIYFLGILLFILIGNAKTKKALKPIHDLTTLASSINENNLNLRIDVESARYELKELCITINSMLDRIERVYVKQKTFVSDVSHELRTPISIIDGYTNMLKRWGSTDETILDESIIAILTETKNMKELIEALLFLARYDNQTTKYESSKVDISGLLEDVYRETKLLDKDKHIINHDIVENLNCLGDYNKLKECIRIFVDNSLKYTKQGKEIYISLKDLNNQIMISIKDNGIGISKKHLGNIFNRFYRAEDSRSKDTGGSGLGLPIARAIVLAHNGKIKFLSKEGKGTTVEIYIPKKH